MIIIFCGLILRVLLAAINAYYEPLPGAEYDALTFHQVAQLVSINWDYINLDIGWIYATALGIIYKYTFNSLFFGCLVSVLAWFISAIVLKKILKELNIINFNVKIILFFYAFLPSSLIFTSITLREPFQLLFYNLMVLSLIQIFFKNIKKYFFLLFLSLAALVMLHKIFLFLSLFVFLFFILLILAKLKTKYKILNFIFLLLFGYFFYENIQNYFLAILPLDEYSIYEIVQRHINNMTISRASYINYLVIINDFNDIILYTIRCVVNYFLQPLPYNHQNVFDTFLFTENLLRLFFVILIFLNLFKFNDINYIYFCFLVIIYISTEILWALGTNNWGTAIRHHLPSFGALAFLAFYSIKKN